MANGTDLLHQIERRPEAAAIDSHLDWAGIMPTPLSAIAFQQPHAAVGRVGVDETAFPHRFDHFNPYIHPASDDLADAANIVRWGRECWEATQPFVD